jgi:hypothetical protein
VPGTPIAGARSNPRRESEGDSDLGEAERGKASSHPADEPLEGRAAGAGDVASLPALQAEHHALRRGAVGRVRAAREAGFLAHVRVDSTAALASAS